MVIASQMGHSDYKEWKFISFANVFIYHYLLYQCQNLKNEAWFPWCSNLSSNSLGKIFLNEIINLFEMSCFIYLDKKNKERGWPPLVLDQYPLVCQYFD